MKIALDTLNEQQCEWCGEPIKGGSNMAVYGVGGSQYVRVFHAECAPDQIPAERIAELRELALELKKKRTK